MNKPIWLAFCALWLAGCCCGGNKATSGDSPGNPTSTTVPTTGTAKATETTPKPAPPPVQAQQVDVKKLLSEYKDNEVRADGQFKGKLIQTTGKVDDVKKDVLDKIYVVVGTGAQFETPTVHCLVPSGQVEKASALSKGKSVTIKGKVQGLTLMSVVITDCEIQ